MADLNVKIGGDPSGALAALAAVQAAIDSLSGKTVTVEVNTRNADRAGAELAALDHALGRATSSASDFAAANDAATSSAASHAAATDRAAASARDHAAAAELAGAAARDLGNEVARAGSQLDTGSGAARQIGSDAARTGASLRSVAGSLTTVGLTAGITTTAVGELGAGTRRADQFMVDAAGSAQRMSRDLAPLSAGAHRAMIELRDFGDGVFRAGGEIERAVHSGGGATDMIGRLVGDAGRAGDTLGGLASSAGRAGVSLGSMGGPLMLTAAAAGLAFVGMGLLTAGTAALGVAAFAATGGLDAVTHMVTKTFDQMSHAGAGTIKASAAFGGFQQSVKGLAAELQQISKAESGHVLQGMQSLTQGATQAARNLAPAIQPAIQAAVDFGNAVMSGLSSPEAVAGIKSFAGAVSANAPAIAELTAGMAKNMGTIGTAVANMAPLFNFAQKGMEFQWGGGLVGAAYRALFSPSPSPEPAPAPAPQSSGGYATGGSFGGGVGQGVTSTETSTHTIVRKWLTRIQESADGVATAAGVAIGVAVGGGMGAGVTTTETAVHTIIKKWITRVVEIASDILGIASPSRVFIGFGQNIADGLAIGVDSHASLAVDATQRMASQAVDGAKTVLGAAQNQLGQLGATGGHPALPAALPQNILGSATALSQAREHARSVQDTADSHATAAQHVDDHRAAVERLHQSETTSQRLQARIQANQERAAQRAEDRKERHEAAMWRVTHGARPDSATPEGIARDAAAWEGKPVPQHAPGFNQPPARSWAGGVGSAVATGVVTIGAIVADPPRAAAAAIGQALGQGMGDGIRQSTPTPVQQAVAMASSMIDRTKKWLGIASPSTVYHDIGTDVTAGMAGGLGAALSSASDGVRGIASDEGLMVGYTWGRSIVTGADAVIKKADFKAAGFPQIESPQAKAALGALGLLGPAGSGAQIWKSPSVTLTPGPAAPAPRIHLTVNLDGQPFRQMTAEQIDEAFDELASSITRQTG